MDRTRPYQVWKDIKKRCFYERDKEYKNYGGRGIMLCDKWLSFEGFWVDMKEEYSDELTIDRIDVNGNYEKSNCRWATHKEQARNRNSNHVVEYNGEKRCIAEWAEIFNMPYSKLYARLSTGCDRDKMTQ